MKPKKFIVLCRSRDGNNGVLFLMREDDFRLDTADYRTVVGGRLTARSVPMDNGRRAKVFLADDGRRYAVFADWSARPLPGTASPNLRVGDRVRLFKATRYNML